MYHNLSFLARRAVRDAGNYYGPRVKLPWQRLGSGMYGAAYRLPDGKVLKISRTCDSTAAWIREAARIFATTGKAGKCMPAVFHYESCYDGWWAVMEYVTTRQDSEHVYEGESGWGQSFESVHNDDYVYVDTLMQKLGTCGAFDTHWANWGYTNCGRVVVFDPGSETSAVNIKVKRPVAPKRQHGPRQGRWA